jgi:precorrin-6B C5,15-methyltransferase / cobalt-precorrin-6B C5,C15-methyltransferase
MPAELTATVRVVIIGIGEDGCDGLSAAARATIASAEVLVGGARHLALVPHGGAERIVWPSPLLPFVDVLVARSRAQRIVVLASGDPLLYGIGSAFARRLAPKELEIVPHVSSAALACARLHWSVADTELISAVARPLEGVLARVQPERRLIVFSENGATPAALAALLTQYGYGASTLDVFEHLGGRHEAHRCGSAAQWPHARCADLNVVAVTCRADEQTRPLPAVPGLRDDAYETDGALTKREVRAATLARLLPLHGQLLWDVGAGTGSIGIEWMRTHPSCRAIAFERDANRAARITRNAHALGVPGLCVVTGATPATLADQPRPDAIFIGGGIRTPEVVERCWASLAPHGRLVANAVTVEGEAALARWQATLGGELVRIAVSRAEPIGSLMTWRPLLPVTHWAVTK